MTTTAEPRGWLRDDALLTIEDLHCAFRGASGRTHAVRGVTLDIRPGETLGLVGESGCGKTTTGRAVLRLPPAHSGTVTFDGVDMAELSHRDMRAARRRLQMIFQDPLSSFNPRRRVRDIVAEGLAIQGMPRAERESRVDEALAQVGMTREMIGDRRAHEFSGGQCQRIAIARALALGPDLIVCDEPVAALDVSVQAHVLNVLQDIRERNDLSLIFVSHDLAVVKVVSDRVAVMHRGRILEIGDADAVYARPAHPYTRRLLAAAPVLDEGERGPTETASADGDDWRDVDRAFVEVGTDHFAALGEPVHDGERIP